MQSFDGKISEIHPAVHGRKPDHREAVDRMVAAGIAVRCFRLGEVVLEDNDARHIQ
jgi:hypothetical protein